MSDKCQFSTALIIREIMFVFDNRFLSVREDVTSARFQYRSL